MNNVYLLLKCIHVIFVVCWLAGLFYVPTLIKRVISKDHNLLENFDQAKSILSQIRLYAAVVCISGLLMMSEIGLHGWEIAKIILFCIMISVQVFYERFFKLKRTSWIYIDYFIPVPLLMLFMCVVFAVVKPSGSL